MNTAKAELAKIAKARPLGMLVALAMLVSLVPVMATPLTVSADDIYVYPGESIQAAIDGANPGDNIYIDEGTYTETGIHVDVNSSGDPLDGLSLVGVGEVTIDGSGGAPLLLVGADGVSVTGLILTEVGWNGVLKVTGSNCEICSNEVRHGMCYNAEIGGTGNTFEDNYVHDPYCGGHGCLRIVGSGHTVTGNIVDAPQQGNGRTVVAGSNHLIYNNSFAQLEITSAGHTWNTDYSCGGAPNVIGGSCMGGNYYTWHSCTDQFQGPDQNLAGSDGICDAPYDINDSGEVDNYPLTPLGGEPDLVIALNYPEWIDQGAGTYQVNYTVKNQGGSIPGGTPRIGTCLTIDGIPSGEQPCPALDPGGTYEGTFEGPFAITDSSDTLELCADCGYVVGESDETNNCAEETLTQLVCDKTINPDCHGCCYVDPDTGHTMCYLPGARVQNSCKLDRDMSATEAHGLIIDAEGITIDGLWHKITGPGCDGNHLIGVYNYNRFLGYGYDNVTIKNLEVEGFCVGIRSQGGLTEGQCTHTVTGNSIEKCLVHDCGHANWLGDYATGIDFLNCVCHSTITNCTVRDVIGGGTPTPPCEGGGMGIRLKGKCSNNDITCNDIHSNDGAGIFAKKVCVSNYIAYNKVVGNGIYGEENGGSSGGIVARCKNSNFWTIEKNKVADNYGAGIFAGGKECVVKGNTVTGTKARAEDADLEEGYGITGRSDGSKDVEVRDNFVCDSGVGGPYQYDILPVFPIGHPWTVENNTCDNCFECTCEYDCSNPVTTYFDFDEDTYYSKGGCACNSISTSPWGVGSCCNPGQFDATGVAEGHCSPTRCNCQTREGNDPNDCDDSIVPPPTGTDLVIEDIKASKWCCCPICINGKDGNSESVLFLDNPGLAEELGDKELREKVAELLAKDPKLAEQIAVKLAADDGKKCQKRGPAEIARCCCCKCEAMKELAGLLENGIDGKQQKQFSKLLYKSAEHGCCCDCCRTADCCCCGGYLVSYRIANEGDEKAGWSLSTLTVDRCGIVGVDIVEPVEAHKSRWEVFWFYRLPGGALHRVMVCGDATDWVKESNEDNNCRIERLP